MKSLLAAAVVASTLVIGANTAQAHGHSGYHDGPTLGFGLFFGTPSYTVRPAYRHHHYYYAPPPRWGHQHWQRHRHWKHKHDWKRHDDRWRHHR